MSNYKPRIESNNLDLTSILSTINELPEAGGGGSSGGIETGIVSYAAEMDAPGLYKITFNVNMADCKAAVFYRSRNAINDPSAIVPEILVVAINPENRLLYAAAGITDFGLGIFGYSANAYVSASTGEVIVEEANQISETVYYIFAY